MSDHVSLWIAKILGAGAGAFFSLIFMRKMTQAQMTRVFAFGLVVGTFFGAPTLLWIEKKIGIEAGTGLEREIIGSLLAGILAYPAFGTVVRLLRGATSTRDISGD